MLPQWMICFGTTLQTSVVSVTTFKSSSWDGSLPSCCFGCLKPSILATWSNHRYIYATPISFLSRSSLLLLKNNHFFNWLTDCNLPCVLWISSLTLVFLHLFVSMTRFRTNINVSKWFTAHVHKSSLRKFLLHVTLHDTCHISKRFVLNMQNKSLKQIICYIITGNAS
jgi:hypothetical protein